ncbi:SgcJ/EcaC family oxidoreductase [Phytoactinopolyspora limicola]|uniref:SgcJ/EcaC family oxidoreductase n=1 Tax=Phytoactinopolyspora limicola TaxID=2715536 RepID=UPI0014094AFC|nr:SgcJ/EcaC family oxidoreductase [Phytoactinopolyspora limicola]
MNPDELPAGERSAGGDAYAVAAIHELIAAAEKHQNDLDEFLDLHTADVSIVNIAGRRVLGKDALREVMGQALSSPLAQVLTTTEVEDIRFVRPDVALVSCVKRVSDGRDAAVRDNPGTALPAAGSLTYVVVREGRQWRIASAQTTPRR